jgi:hypothetical protein
MICGNGIGHSAHPDLGTTISRSRVRHELQGFEDVGGQLPEAASRDNMGLSLGDDLRKRDLAALIPV